MEMNLLQAIKERHSVRSYTDRPIEGRMREELQAFIEQCNKESGLRFQLVLNEPQAFAGRMAHYGKFFNVCNYIALVGGRGAGFEEKCGYFGEKVVLYAQTLGLNTCWVALTYNKGKTQFAADRGEKLHLVIAIGYGTEPGVPHRSKPRERVMQVRTAPPDWFLRGVDAALLAPTAVNQQKFLFCLDGNVVSAKAGMGFYSKIDLGIVKYHFEIGAGTDHFQWAEKV